MKVNGKFSFLFSATAAPSSGPGVDLFGNQSTSDSIDSLALVPVSFATTYEADVPANSGAGTNFVPLSSASKAFGQVFYLHHKFS